MPANRCSRLSAWAAGHRVLPRIHPVFQLGWTVAIPQTHRHVLLASSSLSLLHPPFAKLECAFCPGGQSTGLLPALTCGPRILEEDGARASLLQRPQGGEPVRGTHWGSSSLGPPHPIQPVEGLLSSGSIWNLASPSHHARDLQPWLRVGEILGSILDYVRISKCAFRGYGFCNPRVYQAAPQ